AGSPQARLPTELPGVRRSARATRRSAAHAGRPASVRAPSAARGQTVRPTLSGIYQDRAAVVADLRRTRRECVRRPDRAPTRTADARASGAYDAEMSLPGRRR